MKKLLLMSLIIAPSLMGMHGGGAAQQQEEPDFARIALAFIQEATQPQQAAPAQQQAQRAGDAPQQAQAQPQNPLAEWSKWMQAAHSHYSSWGTPTAIAAVLLLAYGEWCGDSVRTIEKLGAKDKGERSELSTLRWKRRAGRVAGASALLYAAWCKLMAPGAQFFARYPAFPRVAEFAWTQGTAALSTAQQRLGFDNTAVNNNNQNNGDNNNADGAAADARAEDAQRAAGNAAQARAAEGGHQRQRAHRAGGGGGGGGVDLFDDADDDTF